MSSEEKKRLITAQQESGLTAITWCKEQEIKYNTFLKWKRQEESIKWVEAKTVKLLYNQEPISKQAIKIKVSGMEIEIPYSKEAISDLVKVLAI